MKKLLFGLAAASLFGSPVSAQEPVNAPACNIATPAVPAALQEMQYITEARPTDDAKFYIYLCSASWCGPCRAIMPKIVAEYPAIKAAGGEMILLCFDHSQQAGEAYTQKYNIEFPTIMSSFRATAKRGLPGLSMPKGIPFVIFVTPEGKVLHSGFGGSLLNWQEITSK